MRGPRLLLLALLAACAAGAELPSAEQCPSFLSAEGLPASVEEAARLRAGGRVWTDREIRGLYVCRALSIGAEDAAWVAEGLDAQTRARRAFQIRHDARMIARAMMADPAAVAALRARDQERYGHPDGPTWEWLVAKNQEKGLSGDAVYEAIVASAQVTNDAVNRSFGL